MGKFLYRLEMLSKGLFSTLLCIMYMCMRIKPPVKDGGTFKSQVHKNAKRHDSPALEITKGQYKCVAYIKVTCFNKNLTDF